MSSTARPDDLHYRPSTSVSQTQLFPRRNDSTRFLWDLDPYPIPFDRTAARIIKNNSSASGSLRRDIYFILYGIACFGLVPITAHILVPHEGFLRWYAANIAVLQCEYYFKTSIQGFSLLFVSLFAMIFAGNHSVLEVRARNGAGMAVFIIFFARMCEGMWRDAALYMGFLSRGEGGELIHMLRHQAFALEKKPQDALKWGFVRQFEIFMVVYAIAALRKFRVVRDINRQCSNLLSWKSLLRHIAMNTSTEEQENARA